METSLDLISVAKAFRAFRQGKTKFSYPQHLWDAAIDLTTSYSVEKVAKELGICLHYFRSKLKGKAFANFQKVSFVEASLPFTHLTKKVEIEISSSDQKRVFLRTELQTPELLSLIQSIL